MKNKIDNRTIGAALTLLVLAITFTGVFAEEGIMGDAPPAEPAPSDAPAADPAPAHEVRAAQSVRAVEPAPETVSAPESTPTPAGERETMNNTPKETETKTESSAPESVPESPETNNHGPGTTVTQTNIHPPGIEPAPAPGGGGGGSGTRFGGNATQNNHPCLVDQPCHETNTVTPPQSGGSGGGLPLYTTNPLWGKARPSVDGGLEGDGDDDAANLSPPLDPKIIGKADGRFHNQSSMVSPPVLASTTNNSITGLLSGTNAPILGLLILLIIGIILVGSSKKK